MFYENYLFRNGSVITDVGVIVDQFNNPQTMMEDVRNAIRNGTLGNFLVDPNYFIAGIGGNRGL